jgi:hypothetical protein
MIWSNLTGNRKAAIAAVLQPPNQTTQIAQTNQTTQIAQTRRGFTYPKFMKFKSMPSELGAPSTSQDAHVKLESWTRGPLP